MTNRYEIRLKGHLDRQHDWLGGFMMAHRPGGETILTGQVVDQAALFGLLLRIRDLGIPLLSINGIGEERADNAPTGPPD